MAVQESSSRHTEHSSHLSCFTSRKASLRLPLLINMHGCLEITTETPSNYSASLNVCCDFLTFKGLIVLKTWTPVAFTISSIEISGDSKPIPSTGKPGFG